MSGFLAMFPGQGSQSPEMSKELLKESPKAHLIFEEAEDLSKLPLRKICTEYNEFPKLQKTSYQQPSILTHSYAVWSLIQSELGLVPSFYAGHSLGEYSALVASRKLSFAEALQLVCERARAMEEAVPSGLGGMLAVRTKDFDLLSKLCFESRDSFGGVLDIVNFNSKEQYILSGHSDLLGHMLTVLKANKILARKLDVSGPFHSSLMKKARLRMAPRIKEASFVLNENYMITNVTGKVAQPYEAKYLIAQIDSPVLWSDTLSSAYDAGSEVYVEFGPGKVLSSLVRKNIPKAKAVFDTENFSHSLKNLEREFLIIDKEFYANTRKKPFSKTVAGRS